MGTLPRAPAFTRPGPGVLRLLQLSRHLRGHQLEVIQVGHVQDLQVDAACADLGESTDRVHHLGGCARGAVGAQLVDLAADRVRTPSASTSSVGSTWAA